MLRSIGNAEMEICVDGFLPKSLFRFSEFIDIDRELGDINVGH